MGFSAAGGGSFSTGPKMNVTPLIDVLLVLIIVFMVVVINQRPTGLQAELPQPSRTTDHVIPPPQATIVIQIHHPTRGVVLPQAGPRADHPQVTVNEEDVDWDQLRERLRDIFAIRVQRIAYIEADDDIDFQDVADVIAIARVAGVDRMATHRRRQASGLQLESISNALQDQSSRGHRLLRSSRRNNNA